MLVAWDADVLLIEQGKAPVHVLVHTGAVDHEFARLRRGVGRWRRFNRAWTEELNVGVVLSRTFFAMPTIAELTLAHLRAFVGMCAGEEYRLFR